MSLEQVAIGLFAIGMLAFLIGACRVARRADDHLPAPGSRRIPHEDH